MIGAVLAFSIKHLHRTAFAFHIKPNKLHVSRAHTATRLWRRVRRATVAPSPSSTFRNQRSTMAHLIQPHRTQPTPLYTPHAFSDRADPQIGTSTPNAATGLDIRTGGHQGHHSLNRSTSTPLARHEVHTWHTQDLRRHQVQWPQQIPMGHDGGTRFSDDPPLTKDLTVSGETSWSDTSPNHTSEETGD